MSDQPTGPLTPLFPTLIGAASRRRAEVFAVLIMPRHARPDLNPSF
jgi:hypothetical protein